MHVEGTQFFPQFSFWSTNWALPAGVVLPLHWELPWAMGTTALRQSLT